MGFGLPQTRYSHDDDDKVHDNLVEYCIDFLCGHMENPEFFMFALNRVLKEYLYTGDNEYDYLPISTYVVPDLGVVFNHTQNFMEEFWVDLLPPRVTMIITETQTYYVDYQARINDRCVLLSSGPVSLIGEELHDLTAVLACLLLCRRIASELLTPRYRNSHKGNSNGKDKASL